MPMELWPTYWMRMDDLVHSGQCFTCDKVREELNVHKDEISEWIEDHTDKTFFIPMDDAVVTKYAEVQNWASQMEQYSDNARQEFASVADSILIATAAAKDMVVVTFEKSEPRSKKKIKIPDACAAMGVRCCDFNTVLKEMGIVI